jgi:predicted MarR family transcription regulator
MTAARSGGKIVSSAHLADGGAPEMSEFEYGLMVAANAFNRWVTRCMAAAGAPDLATLDALVLHTVNHRDRSKRLADICFTLNVEDTHLVNYALKKLLRAGLVEASRSGKETHYTASRDGAELCRKYREVRETCLVETMNVLGGVASDEIARAASVLRALSGLYDQASRAATSL